MSKIWTRREFCSATATVGLALPFTNFSALQIEKKTQLNKQPVCVFTKHLQWLNYSDAATIAQEIGFDGADIPVRPWGHVLPENIATDLPKAVNAFAQKGLPTPMITTRIKDADDPTTKQILEVAADVGVKLYRLDYFDYDHKISMPENLDLHRERLLKLAELSAKLGLKAAYQNHSGMQLGGPVWDLFCALSKIESDAIGVQYDIRHATVEGGTSWELGLRALAPQINSLVMKDFYWAKRQGNWKIVDCPLGEGMVQGEKYVSLLNKLEISAPLSMHFEYEIFDEKVDMSQKLKWKIASRKMRKDLAQLRKWLA